MRYTSIVLVFFVAMLLGAPSYADAPATEFFAIETAQLAKLAPTDAALDTLTRGQLADISIAHGWCHNGLSMRFDTQTFRIDARFTGPATMRGNDPPLIAYLICASKDQTSWSLLSEKGAATKQGKQYVTEDWRKQQITVIIRYLDLKK